ncbi:MAG TPA: hypothetical protein VHM02_00130 [Thermoanaerobaculia bacterium]|nr:hypothetical protein [Thermoanaerobaculia bacterium]
MQKAVRFRSAGVVLSLGLLALAFAAPALADDDFNEPFVFSDGFFRANGIEPTAVLGLPACGAGGVCDESSPDPSQYSNVRITSTLGAHQQNGDPTFVTIQGLVGADAFTADEAGIDARNIAEAFTVFFFPLQPATGTPALSPAATNLRQNNVLDTRNGYFSNDPLGLWVMRWVSWDGPNVQSQDCQEEMDDLAARNGLDLDGTPQITTVSDIENLQAEGCVTVRTRPSDGSQGPRWLLCPTFKDPTDGVIRPDASLVAVPVSDEIFDEFECLQTTGDHC